MKKKERYFGIIEMVGAVVLLLIDSEERNNRKYMRPEYYRLDRIIGMIVLIVSVSAILYILSHIVYTLFQVYS